jgi:putative ABC transport system ATP-binding protein
MSNLDIICHDLVKSYQIGDSEIQALRGLNLEVERGTFLAIVGASGSGKSTLLSILAGLLPPTSGRVEVAGNNLLGMTAQERARYRSLVVGTVSQQTQQNLLPYLSAVENVQLAMAIGRGWTKKKDAARAESHDRWDKAIASATAGTDHGRRDWAHDLLELVGIGNLAKSRPNELSGGQQQRVALAVALANRPRLLLADEPTGELDEQTADQVLDLIGHVHRELGVTCVLVTHDDAVVARASRTVRIFNGVAADADQLRSRRVR